MTLLIFTKYKVFISSKDLFFLELHLVYPNTDSLLVFCAIKYRVFQVVAASK